MKFKLGKNNVYSLLPALELTRQQKEKNFFLSLDARSENFLAPDILQNIIYQILDYEKYFGLWLLDFPFCLFNRNVEDHILSSFSKNKNKDVQCSSCRYQKNCVGFWPGYLEKFGKKILQPQNDLPEELMLEITAQCNFSCQFCYNQVSFAKEHRQDILSFEIVEKIIKQSAKIGIKIIRFTGGEPLLHPQIFDFFKIAKKYNLEVRLNTNASLINKKNIFKFKDLVDNVLIPIESYQDKQEEKITAYPHALELKTEAIKLLKKINIPIVRVGTVLSSFLVNNFSNFIRFILKLGVDEWEFYRPISLLPHNNKISSQDLEKIVKFIISWRKKTSMRISLANAIPFCAISNPAQLNYVSSGALYDDGHRRLVLDPRGFFKPHYFMEKKLNSNLDILAAWNSDFMQKMRNLKFLPKQCQTCLYRFKCRGGSRYEAYLENQDWRSDDPWANYKNINKVIYEKS